MPSHVNLGTISPCERDLRGEVEVFGGKILARLARWVPASARPKTFDQLTNPKRSPSFVLSSPVHILRGIGTAIYSHSLYTLFKLRCDCRFLIPGCSATFLHNGGTVATRG